jgi:hypothetical protein
VKVFRRMWIFVTLKYENSKEFSGNYGKTTMLIFSDNKLDDENIDLIKKILNLYRGSSGEVIEFKIIFDDNEVIYKILIIIICFNTLLKDISNRNYLKFIEMHKNRFMEYYTKVRD